MKTPSFLLAVVALAFFACSDESTDEPANNPNATADISSQVYLLQGEQIDVPFTGSGVIKNIVRDLNEDMEERPIDTVEVGTVIGGKINLEFYTPKKEHLSENGIQAYWDLKLYDNANNPIGRLFLLNLEDADDSFVGVWGYWSDDYSYKDAWNHGDNKFVTDIDVKRGWSLIYENDKYDYDVNGNKILYTVTKTSNPDILNGKKLKWYLTEPDVH